MTETHREMRPGSWQVPECPLLIEYSPAVLDEIRIAAVDAFFSLPRGGAEIGGVMFGRHTDKSVRIEAFRAMECEHAMGPTFVLSDKDKARLKIQLEESSKDPLLQGLEVVGWYHTHTRSEIFLSDLDLQIYNRYFPNSWQIALVLRPAGMKPTRAGFFFRGRDGSVHIEGSYHEFVLLPVVEAPTGGNGRPEPAAPTAPRRIAKAVTAKLESEIAKLEPVKSEPAPETTGTELLPPATAVLQRFDPAPVRQMPDLTPAIEMSPTEFVPPAFMVAQESGPSRKRLWVALGLLAALGGGAYFTSDYWMQLFAPKPLYLHLQALDHEGQLRIQWDRGAMASAEVQNGSLEIVDGTAATTIPLDAVRLRTGSFQYARRNDVVEVHLMVKTRGGPLEEFTSFYGRPGTASPGTPGTPEKPASELAVEAERARGDLKKEELRRLELERSLDQMKQQMRRDEERKRVENQMPAGAPPPTEQQPPRTPSAPAQTANNVNPAPRTNPPAANVPTTTPSTPNAAPQGKPQGAVQSIVQQATRPLPTASDKPAAPVERPSAPPPQSASSQPPATQPTTRPPVTAPPVQISPSGNKVTVPAQVAPALPSLSGRWVYSPASKSGSAYPPESVILMLVDTNGQVSGTFSGKYKVPKNMKMGPKVNFSFEGTLHTGSSKFTFTAADGNRGQVEIIRLPGKQNAIEVVWYSERDKLTFDDLFFRAP